MAITDQELTQQLRGSWVLKQWTSVQLSVDGDIAKTSTPFGESPKGLLIYSPEGLMSAAVSHGERRRFPTTISPRQLEPSVLADAYTRYFHYAGRWQVRGGEVIHHVSLALNPNMVGTQQRRSPSLRGDNLVLEGVEEFNHQRRVHTIAWQRVQHQDDSDELTV